MSMITKRKLGTQGLEIPAIGLGCMGMTVFAGGSNIYGPADETEAIKTIHRSLELGGNFLDTADIYGPFLNEQLIAKAIKGNRDKYIIATKFGYEIDDNNQPTWRINGQKGYVKKAVEKSLRSLGTDYIDLYYLHRLDPQTPIEETVGSISDLIKEGKVGYIGLSEVSSETIIKAHGIHPVTAVQSEYSLFERSVEEAGIINTLHQLGIGFVAYSPLGRGYLTGNIRRPEDLPADDFRNTMPRFQGDQLVKNLELAAAVTSLATEKGVTPSQLAIAWVLSKGHTPIPGTKRVKYLEQNIAATAITLTADDLDRLASIIPAGTVLGDRYDKASMSIIDQ
ncbi:aldo/keto reductase [Chitinophaga sp. sic0106]|uniref:aldo/keto reductase n=1 Tax=Chitinophaga sp. sic0106 TaxID=2854785 RepID=UPI001C463195|nr:aldo/keto reductase [Chitinophaga sp. sic0106]MBV7531590.1 aldo/keto reductase [Chitinophaga sp. sic0106]